MSDDLNTQGDPGRSECVGSLDTPTKRYVKWLWASGLLRKLAATEREVLLALVDYADYRTGRTRVSTETIGRKVGRDRAHVSRLLRRLVQAEFLRVLGFYRCSNGNSVRMYEIVGFDRFDGPRWHPDGDPLGVSPGDVRGALPEVGGSEDSAPRAHKPDPYPYPHPHPSKASAAAIAIVFGHGFDVQVLTCCDRAAAEQEEPAVEKSPVPHGPVVPSFVQQASESVPYPVAVEEPAVEQEEHPAVVILTNSVAKSGETLDRTQVAEIHALAKRTLAADLLVPVLTRLAIIISGTTIERSLWGCWAHHIKNHHRVRRGEDVAKVIEREHRQEAQRRPVKPSQRDDLPPYAALGRQFVQGLPAGDAGGLLQRLIRHYTFSVPNARSLHLLQDVDPQTPEDSEHFLLAVGRNLKWLRIPEKVAA